MKFCKQESRLAERVTGVRNNNYEIYKYKNKSGL